MATWTVTAQLTTGTLSVNATDRIWFNGSGGGAGGFGINVVVGSYQDTTHISDNTDTHRCTTNHVHNVKYLTSTTMSLDGAGSANLSTLTTGNSPLLFNFADASSVATQSGFFYVYAGSDGTATTGIATIQAAQGGTTSTWVSAGTGITTGSLGLADQSASTSHNFYIAMSVSPASTGAKTTMTAKITLTYV